MKYQLEVDDKERGLIMYGLGSISELGSAHELAKRIAELKPQDPSPTPRVDTAPVGSGGPPAQDGDFEFWVSVMGKDAALVKRYAESSEVPLGPITPTSIMRTGEGDKERLVIEWRDVTQIGSVGGKPVVKKASCWASQKPIWPRVLERVKQPSTFLVKESRGYLSIVGVKA